MPPFLRLPLLARFVLCLAVFSSGFHRAFSAGASLEKFDCGLCYALSEAGQRILLPLESTEVVLNVHPGLIEAEVIQTFTNRTSRALEATYLYPLPHDATVTHFELRYAGHVVSSRVKEKKQARLDYETAKTAGRKAALLERHDPSLFSTEVANFLPGETVQIAVKFIQPLTLSSEAVEVRFPMVTGEKYFPENTSPGTQGASAPTPPKIDANAVATHHTYAYDIAIHGIPARSIESSSHRIQVNQEGEEFFRVALAEEITIPDRDFVLRIETKITDHPQPTVITQHTTAGDFGLLTVFPPLKNEPSLQAQSGRDFLFLIDHSGSMSGTRIESARLGLQTCLANLSPQDRFQVVIFDSTYSFYKDDWIVAHRTAVSAAIGYVKTLRAGSGTEMQPALEASLDFIHAREKGRQPIILFLTDGDVGNEGALLQLLEAKIGNVRLFPFGIGAAPNRFLIEKMAEQGRGQARFINDDHSISRELADLFSTLDAPVLSNLKLTLLDARGDTVDGLIFPRRLPDVFVGRPIQALFNFSGKLPAMVQLEAQENESNVQIQIPLGNKSVRGDGLEKTFGRLWYEDLELQRRRSVSSEQHAAIDKQLLQTALRFQLVSEFTSRVAVDRTFSRDPSAPLDSEIVPQYRAADQMWSGQASDDTGELVTLTPFAVSSSSDSGYMSGSSLAGSRLKTELRDVAGSAFVIPRQVLEDTAALKLEDAVPFVLQPEYNPGASRTVRQTGQLDGLPIATVLDPATISQIELTSSAFSPSSIVQRRAGELKHTVLTAHLGDEGLAAINLQSGFSLGPRADIPVLAIVSTAKAQPEQWSAFVSARKNFGENRLLTSVQARDLVGYGEMRLARASFEHKVSDEISLETILAWHQLERRDPDQFKRSSPTGNFDGLGFFNLDLLTAETRAFEDNVARIQLVGGERYGTISQNWVVRGTWHAQKADWATSANPRPSIARRDEYLADAEYQARLFAGRLILQTNLGVTGDRSPGQTITHRSTHRALASVIWEFTPALRTFLNFGEVESISWVPTGEVLIQENSARAVSAPVERRHGGQVGLRLETLNGRLRGEAALFREEITGSSFRDWAWERDHAEIGVVELPGGLLRSPISDRPTGHWHREGLVGNLSFNPVPAITAVATWYDEWSDEGPYRGGNRRASFLTRYTFQRGVLRNLATGLSVSARNKLTFDDGYLLQAGIRWDCFVTYRWHALPLRWTAVQVNLINLTRCPWQPTRFAVDHGRQVLLSLSQEF